MADSCSAPGDSPPGGGASVSFCHIISHPQHAGFPGGAVRKNPPANAGNARDVDSLPGSGRSPGGGKGNPPRILVWRIHGQRGAWRATVQGVPESQTQLRLSTRVCPAPRTLSGFMQQMQHLLPFCGWPGRFSCSLLALVESDSLQEPRSHVWPSAERLGRGAVTPSSKRCPLPSMAGPGQPEGQVPSSLF